MRAPVIGLFAAALLMGGCFSFGRTYGPEAWRELRAISSVLDPIGPLLRWFRRAGGDFGDAAHAYRVMVSPGQQRRPRR